MDLVGQIMSYESGTLNDVDTIKLFANLIETGMAWKLQGSYGRTAKMLINGGYISEDGTIL